MEITALILAAGRGHRFNAAVAKQYHPLGGRPVLSRTIASCLASDQIDQVIVVIHEADRERYGAATEDLQDPRLKPAVIGGPTRSATAFAGLQAVRTEWVLIHDGARPFVDPEAFARLIETAKTKGAAFLALPVTDTLWQADGPVTKTVPREDLWRAQTPQAFRTEAIRAAHAQARAAQTDDVATALAAGIRAYPVMGAWDNIKITHPQDLQAAENILKFRGS